jgi:chloramphenicol 3-O-phosphotransferase
MCDPVEIDPAIRLILLTGNPGASKTTVAKRLICGLPEVWRLVTLDDFLLIHGADHGDVWSNARDPTNMPIPNGAVTLYHANGGRVIVEGIMQTDQQVRGHCEAMGLTLDSRAVRFIELWASEDEAVRRMRERPLKEGGFDEAKSREHYRGLSSMLRAKGAIRIGTDGKTPAEVFALVLAGINRSAGPAPRPASESSQPPDRPVGPAP